MDGGGVSASPRHFVSRRTALGAPLMFCAVVVLLLAACGSEESGPVPGADLSARRDLVIGGGDEGPAAFSDIRAIGIDASGRIFVADATDNQVRVFDAEGRFVRALGRYGRGPGEFTGLRGIHVSDAGLVTAYDPVQRRVTVFDTAGALRESYQFEISSWGFEWDGGLDPSGRLVDSQLRPSADTGFEDRIRVLDLAQGTAEWHPYPTCGIDAEPEIVHAFGIAGVPFAPGRKTRLDPARGGTWCAHSGRAEAYFVPFGATAPTDTFVSVALPRPVTAAERSAAIANLERQVPQLSASGFDPASIPAVKPLLRAFASDEIGRLWLELHEAEGTAYHVFSAGGEWLARVRVDAEPAQGRQFRVRASTLYIIATDSLGVPTVQRYRTGLTGN